MLNSYSKPSADAATYRRLIHTSQWVRLRHAKLTASPLCERCTEEGRIRAATEVHHILPVEDALGADELRRRMFDAHNLRSLCHACHVLTHTELGRGGKASARRRNAAHAEAFRRKFLPEGGGGTG